MDVTATSLDAAIRERIKTRAWYRSHRKGWRVSMRDLERDNTVALRELLRVRREARRLAAADTYPPTVGYHDWQAAS